MRDLMCTGYCGGGGTGIVQFKTNDAVAKIRVHTDGGSDDSTKFTDCLWPIPLARNATPPHKLPEVISLSGRPLPWEVGADIDTDSGLAYTFAGTKYAKEVLGFKHVHDGEDQVAVASGSFLNDGSYASGFCARGPYRQMDPFQKKVVLMPGTGHFGPDAVPGDARWRRGECTTQASARAALYAAQGLQMA